MDNKRIKVYFLGSGPIGIPILEKISSSPDIELVGAATQPDRPAGRKRILTPTAIGTWADANNIKAFRTASVNSPEFLEMLKALAPEIILLVSFGQILKKDILELPSVSCVNIHASLLPAYRGASPIAAAIVDGEKESGVTFMKMARGLDCGPVYSMYKRPLDGNESADSLEMELGRLAADKIIDDLKKIVSGVLMPVAQDESKSSYAGKIEKKQGLVNWNEPAWKILARMRGYHPWPGAYFYLGSNSANALEIKIIECKILNDLNGQPGTILKADKKSWVISCGQGAVELIRVVPQGRKEMSGVEFLRGCHAEISELRVLTSI